MLYFCADQPLNQVNEKALETLLKLSEGTYMSALKHVFKKNRDDEAQSMNKFLANGKARALSKIIIPESYLE